MPSNAGGSPIFNHERALEAHSARVLKHARAIYFQEIDIHQRGRRLFQKAHLKTGGSLTPKYISAFASSTFSLTGAYSFSCRQRARVSSASLAPVRSMSAVRKALAESARV
jgi:hypothetical protein